MVISFEHSRVRLAVHQTDEANDHALSWCLDT